MSEPTEIVRYESESIVPRTFAEANEFAKALATSSIIPVALRSKAPDVLVMILAGRELGLAPMAALRSFHVIEGTPRLSADGLAAVVVSSPSCEYLRIIESTDSACTWETKRTGHSTPTRKTWTKDMAVRAQIWGRPGPWQKFPHRMLSARAKSELCRDVYPEIAAGLVSVEELEGDEIVTGGPPVFVAPPTPAPDATPPAQVATPMRTRKARDKPAPANGTPPHATDAVDAEIVEEPAPPSTSVPIADVVDLFGGTPPESDAPRTIDGFGAACAAAASLEDLAGVKAEWMPWSRAEGKNHAMAMRDIYKARTHEIGGGK